MHALKLIFLTVTDLVRQIFSLPTLLKNAAGIHRRRREATKQEAERIDRIRNPSKYLGI